MRKLLGSAPGAMGLGRASAKVSAIFLMLSGAVFVVWALVAGPSDEADMFQLVMGLIFVLLGFLSIAYLLRSRNSKEPRSGEAKAQSG